MASAPYKALTARLSDLRSHLLPATFSATNDYTSEELDRARAYRVLAHAELEHFIEQRALGLAQAAFDKWNTASRPSRTLVAFLTNVVGDQSGLPKKLGTNDSVTTYAGKALSQFKHNVSHNNGVKIENILRLLLPIGIIESEIDVTWISTIDGFGAKRGLAAHSSSVTYSINPSDDFNTVVFVLSGLRDLDERISELKSGMK